jgi:hypothetical protein
MIPHLHDRDKALAPLGWTERKLTRHGPENSPQRTQRIVLASAISASLRFKGFKENTSKAA